MLPQSDVPLSITNYKATFQPEFRSSYGSHADQIMHAATYQNISGKDIVAIQIGFVAFDAFNNLIGGFSGWSIDKIAKDATKDGKWTQTVYLAFTFDKYGTGVAYIRAVRFADGSIWQADMTQVLAGLQKFEKDLKKEDIEEKKKSP